MQTYGRIEIKRHDDGHLEIVRADPTIGIDAELLAEAAGKEFDVDAYGWLVIAGQIRYRPIRFAEKGRIIVCGRADQTWPATD